MPGGPSGPSVILASDGRARGSPEQAGQEPGHVGEPWVWLIGCLKEDRGRAIVGEPWHKPGASTCTCKHKHAQTPTTHRHNHTHRKKRGFWKVSCGYKVTHYNKKQTFHFLLWTVLLLSFYLEHRVISVTVSRQAPQKGSIRVCISCSNDKRQPADIVANISVQNRLSKKLSFGNHLLKR